MTNLELVQAAYAKFNDRVLADENYLRSARIVLAHRDAEDMKEWSTNELADNLLSGIPNYSQMSLDDVVTTIFEQYEDDELITADVIDYIAAEFEELETAYEEYIKNKS